MDTLEKLILVASDELEYYGSEYNVELIQDGFILWNNKHEEGRKSITVYIDGDTLEVDVFGTCSLELTRALTKYINRGMGW